MSDHHSKASSSSDGQLPFAPTLRKAIILMVVGFAVPIIILLLISRMVSNDNPTPAAKAPEQAAAASTPAAAAPTAPAASAPAASAPVAAADGKKVYEASCVACHGAGVAGAPKVGDKAAWGPIVAQGKDTLYDHALHGFTGKTGMMPPKGGSNASDADVKAAVDYMMAQAK